MSIILTEKAAFRLRTFIKGSASATPETGVRVGVKDGGCSGYEYALDIADKPNPDDLIFKQDNIPIYIDPISEPLVKGVVIDFVESLTQSGFQFINPNATDTCGCGKSFSVGDCTPDAIPCS
ncbi:MAG: iron-sulfur cluster assembly accessory protein [Hydrococcus sp. C42_A2020_068]|nr:iron-sulfur cluster assembly accessory protein [Hydrococcus sp. C42_A2020_068]